MTLPEQPQFADRLHEAIVRTANPVVIGLDPLLAYIPDTLRQDCLDQLGDASLATGQALFSFNARLIDHTCDIVPAVKLQAAFYEQYGLTGLDALARTIDYARKRGMLVIVDAKRNDIGSTATAYANAYLGQTSWIDNSLHSAFAADALTINGYLGLDGILPFLDGCKRSGKGVFILVRTSNPSAGDLQDLVLQDGRTVYQAMADLVAAWGRDLVGRCGYSSVGAVVGATWPEQARELRSRMPQTMILVPGYGAQGGTSDDAVQSFGPDGMGALVNASRSIMLAWKKYGMDPDLFDLAARKEALAMRAALQEALARKAEQRV